ncbi:Predicted K+/H+-antiporter [Klebsormidium nitens]|uniref:Predicted K+/H+-antiporter n=1 Tax=Klebsormidium nitens TaxID=105231 RepID=A0A1Y1IRJ2_KLENI|nr:Predicted K+/H+-antiporter [Klebsormidium nitens]|eukprot:GAQ91267.1 Predicted K+/H+-antiporter [Klebsormidium nitens]
MTSLRCFLLPVVILILGLFASAVQARARGRAFPRPGDLASGLLVQGRTISTKEGRWAGAAYARALKEADFDPHLDDELFGDSKEVFKELEPLPVENRVIGPLPLDLEIAGGDNDEDYGDSEGGGTLAHMLDKVLEKEFPDEELHKDVNRTSISNFNSSVEAQNAVLETVARVSTHKIDSNESQAHSFELGDLIKTDKTGDAEDVERLIDAEDNVFVISNPANGNMMLQQDLKFIADLVIVIVSAAVGGVLFALLGQPVITGYIAAGSLIGPGCLGLINELVQVETLAQLGVVFLLFALGLEFSAAKLRVVQNVAVFGGLLQIGLFMAVCGALAQLAGGNVSEGIFVGAFMSMSSTAVVLKCLGEKGSMSSLPGQITVGTLILQDCCVGMLFALLPILGGGNFAQGVISMSREVMLLGMFLALATLAARLLLPRVLELVARLSAQSNELFQLFAIAFCLAVAWVTDQCGLSVELGAFAAGVMISSTQYQEHTLHQVEPVRNVFAALFLSSIGMLMNPTFLWQHKDILCLSVVLVFVVKTTLVTTVVRGFGYSLRTALMVGISLAQIGEFAFVLLSRASNVNLIERRVYLLLLGTTALSLVTTPIMFRLMPSIINCGVSLNWLRPEQDTGRSREVVKLEANGSEQADWETELTLLQRESQ